MMDKDIYACDLEADSLNPSVIHCLVATKDGKTFIELTDYKDIIQFLRQDIILVGHNFVRFDSRAVEKLLGIDITDKIIDSLPLSWYLFPDRYEHGLGSWGEEFGVPKPDIEDWVGLSKEAYIHRCREDVKINFRLWRMQRNLLTELYGTFEKAEGIIRYLNFKMHCAKLQEESKWKLDLEYAKEAYNKLEGERQERQKELESVMPKIPSYASRSPPKRPYKSDGSLSTFGERWKKLTEEFGLPFDHNEPINVLTSYGEPNANSHDQIKNWLYSLGWEPQTFKFNKNKETGEIKKVPQVSKPSQEGGGLCPSVQLLYEKEPNLELLDGYFKLTHRISILKGFFRDVDEDGYVVARIAGLTNTLRMKHAEIVNLPKISTAYGEYPRACLIAEDDEELCGSDMSSLEDRLKQHFMYKYDPDYVEQMNVPDFDPHIDLGQMAGMITKEDGDLYKWFKSLKEEEASKVGDNSLSVIKDTGKVRGVAKNGNYALSTGHLKLCELREHPTVFQERGQS